MRESLKIFGKATSSSILLQTNLFGATKNLNRVFHPDGNFKMYWNILLVIGMILSLIIAPYQMAFETNTYTLFIFELILDCIFFIDIIFSCFTAFYDEDMILITSHLAIIKKYLKSWMLIDILACFPLHLVLEISVQLNSLVRLTRFKLLWRLIRITKLLRLLSVFKSDDQRKTIHLALRLSIQIERLLTFLFINALLIHIIACFWILIGKLPQSSESWISYHGFSDLDNGSLYIASLYWTVTTLTTVGYGDIYATNQAEQIFAIILMIAGILSYSYTVSSISNIFSALDTRKALFHKKLDILNNLTRKLKISQHFYAKLACALEYEHKNNDKEVEIILGDLPVIISQQLIQIIFAQRLERNQFFEERSVSFISWVAPWLRPVLYDSNKFVYKENEYANEMFFTLKGELDFVLKYKKTWYPYVRIPENHHFGEVDLLYSEKKIHLTSVRTIERCEVFSLVREKFETMIEAFETEAISIHLKAKKRFDYLNSKVIEALMAIEEKYAKDFEKNIYLKKKIARLTRSDSTLKHMKELNNPEKRMKSIKKSINSINLYSDNMIGMSYELLNILWDKNFKVD